MENRLHKAYQVLGLKTGSSLDTIKKRHRELVKIWHPDKHLHQQKKQEANTKIAEINSAYAYLKSIKAYSSTRKAKTSTSGYSSSASPTSTSSKTKSYSNSNSTTRSSATSKKTKTHAKQSDSSAKKQTSKQTKTDQAGFKQSQFDSKLSSFQNKFSMWQLKRKREIRSEKWKSVMEKERAYFLKLREKYDERTRLGLYRSLFNAVVFGRIIQFESDSTALGMYSLRDKYEIDIRHILINDQIFYSLNRGINLILKYIIGGFSLLLFIYLTLMYYRYGVIPTLDEYMLLQIGVIFQTSLLFIPDNLFQRGLLWKFRNLEKSDIQKTFVNRKLPGKWNQIMIYIFLLKYTFLSVFLSIFLQYVPKW